MIGSAGMCARAQRQDRAARTLRRDAGIAPPRSALLTTALDPRTNQLLAALPGSDRRRWLPQLEPVTLALGQVLYESGDTLSHVYFPTSSIVSLPT